MAKILDQKVIQKDPSYSNAYYNIACNYTLQNKNKLHRIIQLVLKKVT